MATIEQTRRSAASAFGTKTAKGDNPYRFGRPNQQVTANDPPSFRFFCVQTAGGKMKVMSNVTEVTWDDSYAILTGQMTVIEPDISNPKSNPFIDVREGNLIVCQVNQGHGWQELWRMRVKQPGYQVQARQWTYDLQNDLALLDMSRDSFHYKKDKNHPKGWLGHEIIQDVCARFRVPIGQLYVSNVYVKRIGYGDQHGEDWSNKSPLDIIRWVLWHEARHGRRLVLRYSGGKLHVLPFVRSPRLFGLGPQLMDAAFTAELPPFFVSAIQMRATQAKGTTGAGGTLDKHGKKAHVLVRSDAAIKKYGFVKIFKYSPDAATQADLIEEGQLFLAYAARPRFTATLQSPGIPQIQRGDSIVLGIGSDAARKQLVWVKAAQHSVTPGSYTTSVTVTFDDPYVIPKGKKLLERLRDTQDQAQGIRSTVPWDTNVKNAKSDTIPQNPVGPIPQDPGLTGGGKPLQ